MDGSLDRTAADRLLDDPAAADVGRTETELATLLRRAATTPRSEAPAPLLAAMAAEARAGFGLARRPKARPALGRSLAAKAAAVTALVTLTATGAAAADALPQPAQDALASAAERIGVDLPRSDERDELTEDAETETVVEDDPAGTSDDHGESVSTVARTEHDSGREHGDAVSDTARQGADAAERSATADDSAVVPAPNEGDAATEDGSPAVQPPTAQSPAAGSPDHGTSAEDRPTPPTPAADGAPPAPPQAAVPEDTNDPPPEPKSQAADSRPDRSTTGAG